jgi:hypothetical protein
VAVAAGQVDGEGQLRSLMHEALAREGGFAPKQPVYTRGTRVVQVGVDNARREQLQHDAKPLARELAAELVATVKAEDRRDSPPFLAKSLRMSEAGLLVTPSDAGEPGKGRRVALTRGAFDGLITRFHGPEAPTRYLASCPTKLRAVNVNHWALAQPDDVEVVLRTRQNGDARETFATVTPTYTPFDADKIGEALALALPSDARGSLDYDAARGRGRLEALWVTDTKPADFVAGEFFKAGVIVRFDDTGGGSIRVQSVIWQNLCLNLLILDKAIGVDTRIRHVGDVRSLAVKFREAFAKAMGSINPLLRAWGRACNDDVRAAAGAAAGIDNLGSLPVEAVLPGLFGGILDRELVMVPGRKTEVIPKLLNAWKAGEGSAKASVPLSRASLVDAFTRYAHETEADPFVADTIREGAGGLLSSSRPLPYLAV